MIKSALDFFGNELGVGDMFVYAPNSKLGLKIGVVIAFESRMRRMDEDRERLVVKARFVEPNMFYNGTHAFARVRESLASIPFDSFRERAFLMLNPEFYINHPLIQTAIQFQDELADEINRK